MSKGRRQLTEFWCKSMHTSPMWPSHGHYRCRTCGREYPVPWEFEMTETRSHQGNQRLLAHAALPIGNAAAPAIQVS